MLLALTGWMDGGLVSTGTVKNLMDGRNLVEVARIEPAGFYIDNFPGNMEVTALFRPHVVINDGKAAFQSVFHIHFHVVPRHAGIDLRFHARDMADPARLAEHAERVRAALD